MWTAWFLPLVFRGVLRIVDAAELCAYKISEINCDSEYIVNTAWTNGQYTPFVELDARCDDKIPRAGIMHNMTGVDIVIWDYTTGYSSHIIRVQNENLWGGRYLVWSLSSGILKRGFFGALSVHRHSFTASCPATSCDKLKIDTAARQDRGLMDFVPLACGLSPGALQKMQFRAFTDATGGNVDATLSRKNPHGDRDNFEPSFPTPGGVNFHISEIRRCYDEANNVTTGCRKSAPVGTALGSIKEDIVQWSNAKVSKLYRRFITRSNRAIGDDVEHEPWMHIGNAQEQPSTPAQDEVMEEQEPWMNIGAGENEPPLVPHPEGHGPANNEEDSVDMNSCLQRDFKKNLKVCLTHMMTPAYFQPPSYKEWRKLPVAQQRPREKVPGQPYPLEWFKTYPFLGYSVDKDQIYCRSCAMGCVNGIKNARMTGPLITEPLAFTTVKAARNVIHTHAQNKYHASGKSQCEEFIKNDFKMPEPEVEPKLTPERYRILHSGLTSIIKVVLFLGRQGLAFLGDKQSSHTINAQTPTMSSSTEWSSGNFDALIDFRMESGDQELRTHLMQSGGRSKYLHPTVQNKIITMAGRSIQKQILDEARDSRFFSVIADGSTDISQKDQLTIVLRYLHQNRIKEAFVAFQDISGKTRGRHIYRALKRFFRRHRLEIRRLRGLGFDGGSNMAGSIIGVQRRIHRENPKALFVHCMAHKLSLAVFKHFKHQSLNDLQDFLQKGGTFFHTPKRREVMARHKDFAGGARTLKRPIVTRWTEVGKVVRDLKPLYNTVLKTAKEIGTDKTEYPDFKIRAVANGLATTMEKPGFVITVMMSVDVLGHLADLSKKLQRKNLDYGAAVELMEGTLNWLRELIAGLHDPNGAFGNWYRAAEAQLKKSGKKMEIPPIRGPRKKYNDPEVYDQPVAYFRETVVRPILTGIRKSLTDDFDYTWPDLLIISNSIMPWNFRRLRFREVIVGVVNLPEWKHMYQTYKDDINLPKEELDEEYERWVDYWQEKKVIPQTLEELLVATDSAIMRTDFPSMRTLIEIFAVVPVTSASAERSFSNMKLLKSHLRSTMATIRLMYLAILHIHKDRVVSPSELATQYLKVWGRPGDVVGSPADKRNRGPDTDREEDLNNGPMDLDESDEDEEDDIMEEEDEDDRVIDDDRDPDYRNGDGEIVLPEPVIENDDAMDVPADQDEAPVELLDELSRELARYWDNDAVAVLDLEEMIVGIDEYFFGLPTWV